MPGLDPFNEPPTGGPAPHSNQVRLDPTNPLYPMAPTKMPNIWTWVLHADGFDRLNNSDETQPPRFTRLPVDDYRYSLQKAHQGSHPANVIIWMMARDGQHVVLIEELIALLADVRQPGRSDIIGKAVRHSHWKNVWGPGTDKLLLSNSLAPDKNLALREAAEVNYILSSPDVSTEEHEAWIGDLFRDLTNVS